MPLSRIVGRAVRHLEVGDATYIEVVIPTRPVSWPGELASINGEPAPRMISGEQPHLVVKETRVTNDERTALEANAGTVAARHASAYEIEAIDLEIAVAQHPDRLALCGTPRRPQHRSASDSANTQLPLRPDSYVAFVHTRLDLDDIAVACQFCGLGDSLYISVRCDPDPFASHIGVDILSCRVHERPWRTDRRDQVDRSGGCGPRRSEACGRCRITQLSAEWLRTCPEQEHDNQTGLPGRNGQGEARRAPTTTDHERRIELLHIPVGAGLRHSLFVGHEPIEAQSD